MKKIDFKLEDRHQSDSKDLLTEKCYDLINFVNEPKIIYSNIVFIIFNKDLVKDLKDVTNFYYQVNSKM